VTDQESAPLLVDGVDITFEEYETSEPINLPPSAVQTLEREVNDETTRLIANYRSDGTVTLQATNHVGIVSLPEGPTVEIRPKIPGTNLVYLLRYAQGVEAATLPEETAVRAGASFIEAVATLYAAELDSALADGLHKTYRQTSGTEPYLRGQLDTQQQLRRQQGMATKFACSYEELTYDTTVNRAVLYATTLLSQLVRDTGLRQALDRHQYRLKRRVSLTTVTPTELEGVQLTRLTSHYADLLRLTKSILRNSYVDDLQTGAQSSFALLINMDRLFESVVERAVRAAVGNRPGYRLQTQRSTQNLVSGGPRTITIRPDILITDSSGNPQIVGDAKWKRDAPTDRQPSNSDIYQLVAYQHAHDVSGILIYPSQPAHLEATYDVGELGDLTIIELPITAVDQGYAAFCKSLREQVAHRLPNSISAEQ
jgi:5-methylcytosine-specific restriction enzyme subunit McrC